MSHVEWDWPRVPDPELAASASRRLNVGCGYVPLPYWTNLDANPAVPADLHVSVPPLPFGAESLDEVYAGHFVEHLTPEEARWFLAECRRALVVGGRLGIMVPDTQEVMRRYVEGVRDWVEGPPGTWHDVADLDDVCAFFVFSTVQESPHRWAYDRATLRRLLERSGFEVVGEIDPVRDPRVGRPAWYQFGLDARRR